MADLGLRPEDEPPESIVGALVQSMEGKRLPYADLTADNGLESGARPQD